MQTTRAPHIDDGLRNMERVLALLTDATLQSFAGLVPDDDALDPDDFLTKQFRNISAVCQVVKVSAKMLNSRWNKSYGPGGTDWTGALRDGRLRGEVPYYCAKGWIRFSLRVCDDSEFAAKFGDWGILYHGTKGKFVGPILATGFRGGGGAWLGLGDVAVYMSPSIEYCGHPRYAGIEYNPETCEWIQIALECRVKPSAVWKKCKETLGANSIVVDPNISNASLEWLFKANRTDPATGHKYLVDAVVCTGIMLRITEEHPMDLPYWWRSDPSYTHCLPQVLRVDPFMRAESFRSWPRYQSVKRHDFEHIGNPLDSDFRLFSSTVSIGLAWLAPHAFAKGGMRCARFLHTPEGTYVVKPYLPEILTYIDEALGITVNEAIEKDVATYLIAAEYAKQFNVKLPEELKQFRVEFVAPVMFEIGGQKYFGEKYVEGTFVKWNNNAGEVNLEAFALQDGMDKLPPAFCHFTHVASDKRAMIVDIQGWDKGSHALFTDPQVHTRAFRRKSGDRKEQELYRRFSMGNLGIAGMAKFFHTHTCNDICRRLRLPQNPFQLQPQSPQKRARTD